MTKLSVIEPNQSYIFSNYFEMQSPPEDILAYFNYSLQKAYVQLPSSDIPTEEVNLLKNKITKRLPKIYFGTEIARREVLISPILLSLVDWLEIQVKIEYPLKINEQLKGTLDYYINSQKNFLVVEAKREDLDRGFTQLAVELIAVAQWLETEQILYGAVTTGNIWQFAFLEPLSKQITQDLQLYRVPTDLEELFAILLGILS
ncbi:hypothetical protein IQ238_15115 [Pleurocapsales cyanobacterium LEGE 06147]|nr:hypothetical protein [Pleurocapsales cyanobacterium LEGE 06147]